MKKQARFALRLALGASFGAMLSTGALAQTATDTTANSGSELETIVVTAQKRSESVQDVPIAVSAFGQGTLDRLQIDGGPGLLLAIPNVSFSKDNFTSSGFAIRGIGSKAVGASADNTVGIHQNGVPLTSNRLFEAEFFDVERVEVLRGPQGTLYGRNATGGVMNVITNKPDPGVFSSSAELTIGDYGTLRARGHVNIPVGENFALRIAGTMTQRDGYSRNLTTMNNIDGRDLNAFRISFGGDVTDNLRFWVSYDRFHEDDNRVRASSQACATDPGRSSIGGMPVPATLRPLVGQGCLNEAIDSPASQVGVYNSGSTIAGIFGLVPGLTAGNANANVRRPANPRDIYSSRDPIYRGYQTLYEGQVEWDLTDDLTLSYLGSYNTTGIFSNEDFSKTAPGTPFASTALFPGGIVHDPILGDSNTFSLFDLSRNDNSQSTHELRLQSDYDGRFNFTVGGISIDYQTITDYYVFFNTGTAYAQFQNFLSTLPVGAIPGTTTGAAAALPIDPGRGANNIPGNITDSGRNYFLSRTPYNLSAYAFFSEFYFDVTSDVRATLGLRYTSDNKTQRILNAALGATVGDLPLGLTNGLPYYETAPKEANFTETTGKFNLDWSPDLVFTDDTLIYATVSRGYKGGGINPPGSVGSGGIRATFAPEFVNAFELGTKNQIGDFRLNADVFYYDYQGYQVSKIVNRTSANENIDATIMGAEFEMLWRPTDHWTFNANIGLLSTDIQNGASIDVLNRTQNNPAYITMKAANGSNCIVPVAGMATYLAVLQGLGSAPVVPGVTGVPTSILGACSGRLTGLGVTPSEGFDAQLTGNQLPNSPNSTVSLGAQYDFDVSPEWSGLARVDYYQQAASYSRVYNTAHDRLPAWSNVNATLRLNHSDGFYVEVYGRNLTDELVVTDSYLGDDSVGLSTNVFYTEPRQFGITVGMSW